MSAEDVYRALMGTGDDLGLATIYRVLTQFESAGLVIRHHFAEGHAVFELDSGEHHDHIVCIDCGKVTEFVDRHHRAPPDQDREGAWLPARRSLAGAARALRPQGLRPLQTLTRAAPAHARARRRVLQDNAASADPDHAPACGRSPHFHPRRGPGVTRPGRPASSSIVPAARTEGPLPRQAARSLRRSGEMILHMRIACIRNTEQL